MESIVNGITIRNSNPSGRLLRKKGHGHVIAVYYTEEEQLNVIHPMTHSQFLVYTTVRRGNVGEEWEDIASATITYSADAFAASHNDDNVLTTMRPLKSAVLENKIRPPRRSV